MPALLAGFRSSSSDLLLTGGLPQQITVLVVTQIVAVRLVAAWTNSVLKRVQVLAVVCGLAYRLGLEVKGVMMKAGRRFVGKSVLGCESVDRGWQRTAALACALRPRDQPRWI